jgi:hypothetical protein
MTHHLLFCACVYHSAQHADLVPDTGYILKKVINAGASDPTTNNNGHSDFSSCNMNDSNNGNSGVTGVIRLDDTNIDE